MASKSNKIVQHSLIAILLSTTFLTTSCQTWPEGYFKQLPREFKNSLFGEDHLTRYPYISGIETTNLPSLKIQARYQ